MDAEVTVRDVKRAETRSGNTRWTLVDDAGKEYTTFRPAIGEQAERANGRRARISFHEEERNGFHNVYLDAIEPASAEGPGIRLGRRRRGRLGNGGRGRALAARDAGARRGDRAGRALREARAVQAARRGGHPRRRRLARRRARGGVGVRVMEHVHRPLALMHLERERVAGLAVVDGDENAPVVLAPEQPDLDPVERAAVELARSD
jgi:hypothetical protein